MPCCALILSLLAQPLLAIPGVRQYLARLMPADWSCCEPAVVAAPRSLLMRSRILIPLFAVEFLLLSVGTAGAVQMFESPALTKTMLRIPICSAVMHGALTVFAQH